MREAICSTCGAINHADAPTCWRCLAEVRPATARHGSHADPAHAATA